MVNSKPLQPSQINNIEPRVNNSQATNQKNAKNQNLSQDKKNVIGSQFKEATLLRQEREPWTRDYSPLEIRFLTGAFKDQLLDIGFNVKELSTSQSAEWSKNQGQSIRVGHNFVSISPRTFDLTLEYWSVNEDVQQLLENNAHLHEISDNSATPPRLQFAFGTALIDPLICTSFDIKYDTPLPNKKGMRHGTVQLKFELLAGVGTKHQLAPPLAPTPLGNYKQRTTQSERERRGTIGVTQRLLASCLSPESNEQIGKILDENKLGDPAAIAALPSDAFINLVVAGSVPREILNSAEIQEKLKRDLAKVMAKRENGVNQNNLALTLEEAILSGDTSQLPTQFTLSLPQNIVQKDGTVKRINTTLYESIVGDYQTILTALIDQKLDPNSPIFSNQSNPTVLQRLNNFGSCGLSLRNNGAPTVADVSNGDVILVSGINHAISLAKSDEEIKKLFGLPDNTPETIIRKIKNGAPYKSKDSFLSDASYNDQGITSRSLWSSFATQESQTLSEINTFITKEGVTDDDIKKRFGVGDEELIKIKNSGKAFASKEDFLKAISKDQPLNGKGNEIWQQFKLSQTI